MKNVFQYFVVSNLIDQRISKKNEKIGMGNTLYIGSLKVKFTFVFMKRL